MTFEDDSHLLQMVEAYCLTARARQNVKSGKKFGCFNLSSRSF